MHKMCCMCFKMLHDKALSVCVCVCVCVYFNLKQDSYKEKYYIFQNWASSTTKTFLLKFMRDNLFKIPLKLI